MASPSVPVLSRLLAPAAADPARRPSGPATAPATELSATLALATPPPAVTNETLAITPLPRDTDAAVRAGNAVAAMPPPRDSDDREAPPSLLAIAEPTPMRTPLRVEGTAAASPLLPTVSISTAPAIDLAVETSRLGGVRIGIEGGGSDLKVSLELSPAAAALVVAEAPRLIADLVAGGVRLQSLDVSGGGTGGQPPPAHPTPSPRAAAPSATTNAPMARLSTADRYA
jgi:hypothetical protein